MVWASRWSVALRAFYRQILSLTYSFFSLKLPPPACPGTTGYIRIQFCHRATVFPLHTWALLCPFPEEDVWQKPGKSKNQTLPRVVGSGILEYLDQTKDHSTCLVDWTSREEIILLVDDCGFCNAKAGWIFLRKNYIINLHDVGWSSLDGGPLPAINGVRNI